MKNLIYIILTLCTLGCRENDPVKKTGTTDSLAMTREIQALGRQIESDADNPELYFHRAGLYFSARYYDRAEADLKMALKQDSTRAEYFLLLGRIHYAMNKTIQAAAEYEKAIQLKPDYTEARLKLAELYLIVLEHQKSLDLINTVLSADKSNSFAWYLKGLNYKDMGDTARAITGLQNAVEYNPDDFNAYLILANLLSAQHNRLAIEYYTAALRLRPTDEDALFGRALFYQQAKLYKAAVQDYRKVSAVNPTNHLCYYNVGYINFEVKKLKDAIKNFDICIKINNSYLPAYYMRGLCYEILNQPDEARLNYNYVLGLDPAYQLARTGLSRLKK